MLTVTQCVCSFFFFFNRVARGHASSETHHHANWLSSTPQGGRGST